MAYGYNPLAFGTAKKTLWTGSTGSIVVSMVKPDVSSLFLVPSLTFVGGTRARTTNGVYFYNRFLASLGGRKQTDKGCIDKRHGTKTEVSMCHLQHLLLF